MELNKDCFLHLTNSSSLGMKNSIVIYKKCNFPLKEDKWTGNMAFFEIMLFSYVRQIMGF